MTQPRDDQNKKSSADPQKNPPPAGPPEKAGPKQGSGDLPALPNLSLDSDEVIARGQQGRTAYALRGVSMLRYFGIDVVPELIAYAEQKVARPDWRFAVVEGLSVPEKDAQADFVVMFSVLTHLTAREGRRYVADALRVLKPGGRLLGSFLDETVEVHRDVAGGWLEQTRNRLHAEAVLSVMLVPASRMSACIASGFPRVWACVLNFRSS